MLPLLHPKVESLLMVSEKSKGSELLDREIAAQVILVLRYTQKVSVLLSVIFTVLYVDGVNQPVWVQGRLREHSGLC